jgi:hypothetical protein
MKKLTYVFAVLLVFGMLAARPVHAQLSNSEIQSLLATLIAQVQELQRQLVILQQSEASDDLPTKPVVTYVQAPAGDKGVIYAGERASIYGSGLQGDLTIKLGSQEPQYVKATGVSHSYAEFVAPDWAGDAYVGFSVINSKGVSSDPGYTVKIIVPGDTNKKSLDVTYPKGGEKFEAGDKVSITWDSKQLIANEPLELRLKSPSCATTNYLLAAGIKNNGSYTWEVSEDLVSEKCDYNVFLMVSNIKSPVWTSSESGAFQIVR